MTKSTLNQLDYTSQFIQAAGLELSDNEYSQHWIDFWWNHTDINHLRLSKLGMEFISKKTKIPIYTITLSHSLLPKHLVDLVRIKIGPYYIHKDKILLTDSDVATMLLLHNGNLDHFLRNLKL